MLAVFSLVQLFKAVCKLV